MSAIVDEIQPNLERVKKCSRNLPVHVRFKLLHSVTLTSAIRAFSLRSGVNWITDRCCAGSHIRHLTVCCGCMLVIFFSVVNVVLSSVWHTILMLHIRCVFTIWVHAVVFESRPFATCCNAVLLILRIAPSFDPFASLPRLQRVKFSSVVTFRRCIHVSQRPQRRQATAHDLSVLMVTLTAKWLLHRLHCIISLYNIN